MSRKVEDFKVLFIYPNLGTPFSFHPGIQILSAVLKKNGYSARLLHLHEKHGLPDEAGIMISEAKKYEPNLIGFTATSFEYDTANRIAGEMKGAFSNIPIILGGIHATIKPDDIESSNFDAFCIGEGENALIELARRVERGEDYSKTGSFWFKTENGIIRNPQVPIVRNLDELPFYDMDVMDTLKLLRNRNGWLSIGFSRGCPYDCSFCINSLLKRIICPDGNLKNYLRKRSVDKVIQEFESIIERYGKYIEVFNFDDDLLMLYKDWMVEFSKKYKKRIYEKYHITYAMNARVNTMDGEIVELMAKSGCREIRIGFETGSFELRKTMLNKAITDEQLINAFALCDKYGIKSNAFAMIGIPGETHETVQKTLQLLARLKPYLIRLTFLYPIYHTKIYDYCREHNLFKGGRALKDEFTASTLKFENISDEELLRFKLLFPWYLNTYLPVKAGRYLRLIDRFKDMSYEELRKPLTHQKVIKMDSEISEELERENLPHYCYFKDNLYYYQLKGKS